MTSIEPLLKLTLQILRSLVLFHTYPSDCKTFDLGISPINFHVYCNKSRKKNHSKKIESFRTSKTLHISLIFEIFTYFVELFRTFFPSAPKMDDTICVAHSPIFTFVARNISSILKISSSLPCIFSHNILFREGHPCGNRADPTKLLLR